MGRPRKADPALESFRQSVVIDPVRYPELAYMATMNGWGVRAAELIRLARLGAVCEQHQKALLDQFSSVAQLQALARVNQHQGDPLLQSHLQMQMAQMMQAPSTMAAASMPVGYQTPVNEVAVAPTMPLSPVPAHAPAAAKQVEHKPVEQTLPSPAETTPAETRAPAALTPEALPDSTGLSTRHTKQPHGAPSAARNMLDTFVL